MEKNNYWIKPAKVHLHILPAIETENMSRDEIKALDEKLRQEISNERNLIIGK